MDEKEKIVMDAGVQYGMQMLQQMPKGDRLEMEAHITDVPHERFVEPRAH